jgi:hypothetical protein
VLLGVVGDRDALVARERADEDVASSCSIRPAVSSIALSAVSSAQP